MKVKTKTETILTFEPSQKFQDFSLSISFRAWNVLVNYCHQSSIFTNFELLFLVFSTHFGSE